MLVVAAVFVVVLIGAILGRTQQKRGGGIFARAFFFGGRHDDLEAANVDAGTPPPGEVRTSSWAIGTSTKGAKMGT